MYNDPQLTSKWSRVKRQMDRAEVDAQHSDDFVDGYSDLAGAFNDYETYDYPDNACVRYDRRTKEEKAVVGMELIFRRCSDLNPSDNTRPLH
eukprot:gene41638-51589_t